MPKYKSPDGRVFDHILKAEHYFCHKDPCGTQFYCAECPIYIQSGEFPCDTWVFRHADEAARMMGYEVIEDSKPEQRPTRADILHEAERCVYGQREQDYGSPENNFETIGLLWGVYLRAAHPELAKVMGMNHINAKDVAIMMALLKVARIAKGNGTVDSFVDCCGYIACGGEIAGSKKLE